MGHNRGLITSVEGWVSICYTEITTSLFTIVRIHISHISIISPYFFSQGKLSLNCSMKFREAARVQWKVIRLEIMKNISAILQLCTNTAVYKQLCYGNFFKRKKERGWRMWQLIGMHSCLWEETVRKPLKRITAAGVFVFSARNPRKKQKNSVLIKKDVSSSGSCFLSGFRYT